MTNRQIRFAEAWTDSQSQSFNLTAGIIEINDQDKSKSTGVLYPAAQLILDKEGQLQWDLRAEPVETCRHSRLERHTRRELAAQVGMRRHGGGTDLSCLSGAGEDRHFALIFL